VDEWSTSRNLQFDVVVQHLRGNTEAPLPCSDVEVNQASEPLILNPNHIGEGKFGNDQKAEDKGTKPIVSSRLHFRAKLPEAHIFPGTFPVPTNLPNLCERLLREDHHLGHRIPFYLPES
jgi:hypothetical protein